VHRGLERAGGGARIDNDPELARHQAEVRGRRVLPRQGVKHTTKKIEHLKHGKTKKTTITTWTPNATVHHLPAVLALKLTGLKTGTQTLKVVVSYKKTVTKHGHKRTETVAKTLTTKFNIC
jgi:hypothetical protein